MKKENEIRARVRTLELATEDAERRIGTNPTDINYVQIQRSKIKEWAIEKKHLLEHLEGHNKLT